MEWVVTARSALLGSERRTVFYDRNRAGKKAMDMVKEGAAMGISVTLEKAPKRAGSSQHKEDITNDTK